MLYFLCDELLQEGAEVELWTSLDAARTACAAPIYAVDAFRLTGARTLDGDRVQARVHTELVQNADPYRPPKPVTAAGGYVVRQGSAGPEVLLIFRRGVWDLPKGKLDRGEAIEACALREVREEVGIEEDLRVIAELPPTVHGYPEGGAYRVKTTHWYLMRTSQQTFTPQASENIERVMWAPWAEARTRLGFETLRRHMDAAEATVRAHVGAP